MRGILCFDAVTASEESTDSKPHQTPKYRTMKRQNASELYSSGLQQITVWDQKMQNPVFYGAFLAISRINTRSAVTNYRKYMIINSVSHVRHAASKTEDGLPVDEHGKCLTLQTLTFDWSINTIQIFLNWTVCAKLSSIF